MWMYRGCAVDVATKNNSMRNQKQAQLHSMYYVNNIINMVSILVCSFCNPFFTLKFH